MTTPVSTKFRLVRCPKCRQVLAELPDIFLYQCGGCGTILQAKNRKMEVNHCELSSQATDSTAKTQLDNVSEKGEARSLNHDLTSPPKEESLLDKVNIRYHDEHVESSTELSEDRSVSNGLSSSPEVNCLENEDSPNVEKEYLNHDKGKCSLDQNSERDYGELRDSDEESSPGKIFSREFPSSSELIYHGTEELTPEANELVKEYDKSYLDQHAGESLGVWQEGDNFLDDGRNSSEHEDQENVLPPVGGKHGEGIIDDYVHLENDEKSQHHFVDPNEDSAEGIKHTGLNFLCTEIVSYENGNASQSVEPGSEVDDIKRSSTEKILNPSVGDSFVASQCTFKESVISANFTSADDERLHHSPKKVSRNFGSASSVEQLGSSLLADTSPELRVRHGETTESPSIRSFYAYDGSESSNDEIDGDNFLDDGRNLSEHEDQENVLPPVGGKHGEGIIDNYVHLENDEKSQHHFVDPNEDSAEGIKHTGVNSLCTEIVSYENGNTSQSVEPGTEVDGIKGPSTEKILNPSVGDSFVASHCAFKESVLSANFTSADDEHPHHSPKKVSGKFGSASSVELLGSSLLADTSPELRVRHGETTESPAIRSFYAYDGSESSNDEMDGDNFLDDGRNLSEHEDQENVLPPVGGKHGEGIIDNYVHLQNDEKSQHHFVDPNEDSAEGIKHTGVNSLCTEIVSYENGNASQSVEPGSEVDDIKRPSTEKILDPSVGDSFVTSQCAFKESVISAIFTSADDEHPHHSPKKVSGKFGSASSMELLGSPLLADTSPELIVRHGETTESPAIRSFYAYDGSESSNDEIDDQIPVHIPHSSRRKGKGVDHASNTAMLKKDGFRVKSMLNSEPKMNYAPSSSSALQGNHHHAIRGNHWNQDEFIETKMHSHTSGNTMRSDEGGTSRLPFTSRDLPANHRTRNPSIYRHNLPPPHPQIHSPDKPLYSEPDKMDLLRTVCELKDQLNRIQFPKISRNRRFPDGVMKEESAPFYYDHLTPGREIFGDLDRPGYYLRYNQEKGWAERSNYSRLGFSAEAAHHRHQVNCSCLQCYSQNWHCSAQLPSHSPQYKNDHSVVHNGHSRRNISSSSGPQHYMSSELSLWGHETKSDSQRQRDAEMKRLYLRGKYHTAKKHLPVAGGAPFVSCYHCSELLQLPADFLLFEKRYHRLRCNACLKVLKFCLVKRTHVVPCLPDASSAPPPSEAGDYSDVTNQRNLDPRHHSNFYRHGARVSYSDDYGLSFYRSYSTEGEASVIVPSNGLVQRNRYNRKMSSDSSYEATEDGKLKSILKESMNNNNNNNNNKKVLVETFESVGPSSELPNFIKASSEIEELPPSNSPLHRLMGYTSPSQVLYR